MIFLTFIDWEPSDRLPVHFELELSSFESNTRGIMICPKKHVKKHFTYLILKMGKMGHFKKFEHKKVGHFKKLARDQF